MQPLCYFEAEEARIVRIHNSVLVIVSTTILKVAHEVMCEDSPHSIVEDECVCQKLAQLSTSRIDDSEFIG